jgi:hypothetical protein
MKRNAEGEAHIVYGYLRAKDSGTGKAGSPYYIGIGSSHTRAFAQHTRGGKDSRYHNVPVPKNEALVRQFGVFKTRAEAAAREQALIAQYGRKGLDPGGTLLNRTLGGEGVLGHRHTAQSRAKMSESSKGRTLSAEHRAKLSEISKNMSAETRAKMSATRRGKAKPADQIRRMAETRLRNNAIKMGIDPDRWIAFSDKQRDSIRMRYRRGKRGADLFEGLI